MNKTKKIKWIFRIILISVVGLIVLHRIIENSRFKADYKSPDNRNEAWQQDLTHFQENYFKICKSFPKDSVFKANQIIDSIKHNINGYSDNKIQLLISQCVSMADDAHTSVHFGKFRRIPLRLYLFDDGLYVIKAKIGNEKYLGYRVNKICDKPIDELIKKLDYYMSGNDSRIKYKSSYFFASPDFFEGAGISKQADSIKYEFVLDIDTITAYMPVIEKNDWSDEYDSWRDLTPSNIVILDTTDWIHIYPKNQDIQLYLSEPNIPGFFKIIDSLNSLYIQINTSTTIKGFNKDIENTIETNSIQNLIIDLRLNGGGNYIQQAAFSKILPKTFNGKIFIVTGFNTFSAGICTAARLKYYSKDKAVIIGQDIGDKLQFWAEGKQFRLPNSKIHIRATNGYHDWENNNFIPFKTFWLNIYFGVPAKSMAPNIPVKQYYIDYINGMDRIMTEIKQHLHNN